MTLALALAFGTDAPLVAARTVAAGTLDFSIADLGVLPGDSTSAAFAINDAGQAVGYSGDDFGEADARPVLFHDGTVTPLGFAQPQDTNGIALGVSNSGLAVGFTQIDVIHAALFNSASASDLGRLSSVPAPGEDVAYSINSRGQGVGYSQAQTGLAARPDGAQATLFSDGTATSLGMLPGDSQSVAYSMNDSGQAVGYSQDATTEHAVMFSGGAVTNLGALPGDLNSAAFAINDLGQSVGYSGGVGGMHAVMFEHGNVTDLGALPADVNSQALAINAYGDAVGVSDRDGFDEHAVIFHAGRVIALQSLLPRSSGWIMQVADGINSSGQIVGYGLHNGERRAFLLTPPVRGIAAALAAAASTRVADRLVPAGPAGPPGSPTGIMPKVGLDAPVIYLHYDYMVLPGPNGHTDAPLPNSIRAVVAAFAAHGIELRVDPRHAAIPERKVLAFKQPLDPRALGADGANFEALKSTYFTPTDLGEHYVLFGYDVNCDDAHADGLPNGESDCDFGAATAGQFAPSPNGCAFTPDASGCSDLPGPNSIVSLGGLLADIGFAAGPANRFLFFAQGGTFMHELGHSLGLHHGGGVGPSGCPDKSVCDDINYKPNYVSVMNYAYQFSGIDSADAVGSAPADPVLTRLDYSGQVLPTGGPTPGVLDENGNLDEPAGLGSGTADLFVFDGCLGARELPTTGPVDWNQDGDSADTNVTADLNPSGNDGFFSPAECDEFRLLRGHNDWADLLASLTNAGADMTAPRMRATATEPELSLKMAVQRGLIKVAPSRRWAYQPRQEAR
jgi:probable HAF family extracellular repeat protein